MSFQLNSSQGEEAEHWTFRGSGLCPLKFDPVATYCYFLVKENKRSLTNAQRQVLHRLHPAYKKDYRINSSIPSRIHFYCLLTVSLSNEFPPVRVTISVPNRRLVHASALLRCQFALGSSDELYAVKWYRDGQEFYRYIPAETPSKIAFSRPGIHVLLDESDDSQVYLRSLSGESSGIYECQVSTEGPHFHTASDKDFMLVIVPPITSPTISGLRGLYSPGDRVEVNCTSAPSQPAANLSWIVNSHPAKSKWITDYGQIQLNDGLLDTDETEQSILGLVSSTLALQLPANLEFFPGRVLSLRCVAVLGAREWKAQRWTILHQGITRYPGRSSSLHSSHVLLSVTEILITLYTVLINKNIYVYVGVKYK